MRDEIKMMKAAMKPTTMKRENFEIALTLAIEIQARHEFDEWRMKCAAYEFLDQSNPPESILLAGFRAVLAGSKEGRRIDVE